MNVDLFLAESVDGALQSRHLLLELLPVLNHFHTLHSDWKALDLVICGSLGELQVGERGQALLLGHQPRARGQLRVLLVEHPLSHGLVALFVVLVQVEGHLAVALALGAVCHEVLLRLPLVIEHHFF